VRIPVSYYLGKTIGIDGVWWSISAQWAAEFIFLVIHLKTFWVWFNLDNPLNAEHRYYEIVTQSFQNPVYSSIYILTMILLGFHLNHGFQSAFQTFGWNHKKYFPLIEKLGFIYSWLTALLFASIPVYFLFFYGGK